MVIDLSTRLRQLRMDKQLRQDQVARLVGVSKGAISAYETDIRQPSYDSLIRLANLYRVSTDYLLGREDTRSLDVSELTAHEVAIVCELVAAMSAKNQKMGEYQERRGLLLWYWEFASYLGPFRLPLRKGSQREILLQW